MMYRGSLIIGDIPQLDSFSYKIGFLNAKYRTGFSTTTNPTTKEAFDAYFSTIPTDIRLRELSTIGICWKQTSDSVPTGAEAPPSPIPATGAQGISYELDGYVYCQSDGQYSFICNSDDAAEISIDDVVKYYYYNGRGCTADYSTTLGTVTPVTLTSGWHKINCKMTQGGGGYGQAVGWKKPGDSSYSTIPKLNYGYK